MRLLLDESVPRRFARSLATHVVRTTVEMGWSGIKNGELLARAANEFDALVTVDKNLEYQQNLKALPIAVVVLYARSNELPYLLPLIPKLEEALANLPPREVEESAKDGKKLSLLNTRIEATYFRKVARKLGG